MNPTALAMFVASEGGLWLLWGPKAAGIGMLAWALVWWAVDVVLGRSVRRTRGRGR